MGSFMWKQEKISRSFMSSKINMHTATYCVKTSKLLFKVYKWWLPPLIEWNICQCQKHFLLHNCSDFLGVKICHFVKTLWSEEKWSREFFGKFLKNCHISRKKVMKSPRFLNNLGRFLAFFFWNCQIIYLTTSSDSPIQKRIPRFSTSLFVL